MEKETGEKEEVVVKGKGLSEKEEKENKSSVFVRMYKRTIPTLKYVLTKDFGCILISIGDHTSVDV